MRFAWAVPLVGVVAAASSALAQPQVRGARSTAAEREEVSITVYNQNFGLVREVRNVDVGTGRLALELRDVASTVQPATVAIKAGAPGALRVLEQNYRHDLLSPQTLLAKYVGRKIKVYRYDEKLGTETPFDAEVLSVANGVVLKIGGEITFDFKGRFAFPDVPPNLIAKPTLVWLLDSQQAKQKIEVTYLAGGMTWSADYVMVVDDKDSGADLRGWVTLVNQSGASYPNAKLKLVAGDVQRVSGDDVSRDEAEYSKKAEDKDTGGFREEAFFEYHLYTLEQPTNVLDNEQKQVTLLNAGGIKVDKRLVFNGQPGYYRGRYGQVQSNQKVSVFLDVENTEKNHLGIALPKGVVRVYKADRSGAQQFIGEDRIDHTPRDEKVRIKMGEAFDVVGERKQTGYTVLGDCSSESAWEISLRNHKGDAVEVEDVEPIGGDWTIVQSSQPYTKKDAHTFTFAVKIGARGETKVTYRVRVRWC